MSNPPHDDGGEERGAPTSTLLAGLGIDPSRLLPFLATEGRPPTTSLTEGRDLPFDLVPAATAVGHEPATASVEGLTPPLGLAPTKTIRNFIAAPLTRPIGGGDPTAAPPADLFGGPRPSSGPLSGLAPEALTRDLAAFNPDVSSASPSVSGFDRLVSATYSPPRADAAGPSGPGGLSISPTLDDPAPVAAPTGRANFGLGALSLDSVSTSVDGVGGLDARLARAVDRLERIADLLDQSSAAGRGGASRVFRGRVDA
jgi:hypothetical protein